MRYGQYFGSETDPILQLIFVYSVVVVVVVVLLLLLVANVPTKLKVCVVSNRIRMKIGRTVLQVNTHRVTESDFRFDVPLLRRWP